MAFNLIEALQGAAGPILSEFAGKALGMDPATASTAVSQALPALVGGLVKQAGDPQAARGLFELISGPKVDAGVLDSPTVQAGDSNALAGLVERGRDLLPAVLGDQAGQVAGAVAAKAGVPTESATSLLALGAPMLLSLLKGKLGESGSGYGGFVSLLTDQQGWLAKLLDGHLLQALGVGSLASLFGGLSSHAGTAIGAVADAGGEAKRKLGSAVESAETAVKSGLPRWLWWVIPLAILAFFGLRYCGTPKVPAVPEVDIKTPVASMVASAPALFKLAGIAVDVQFDTDSAAIGPQYHASLDKLADDLKASGKHGEIAGHTDNVGDAAHNKTLSEQRAAAVRDYLIGKGVAADALTAVGYGDSRPIADNSTEEGRHQNRRIEFVAN
ncbi:OmpA family protein [Jeongeupia naejangsanensis]|uniref:OmpA family protein n=1 Tax=Jeongeupia naejangsanensis TaxID=613195 RepID=A0ABS2BMV9_9NEIS|nr:OmpA family protein [Jeongeupia naejangsanensis]MBM3116765.1 OmpA family protein [Jeongeupia naejangsanensis]